VPADKDGLGYIGKVGMNGKMIEECIFPANCALFRCRRRNSYAPPRLHWSLIGVDANW
jgi:hypothetical protein